jgi:hypothetical protein
MLPAAGSYISLGQIRNINSACLLFFFFSVTLHSRYIVLISKYLRYFFINFTQGPDGSPLKSQTDRHKFEAAEMQEIEFPNTKPNKNESKMMYVRKPNPQYTQSNNSGAYVL